MDGYTRCDQKISVIIKFSYVRFSYFFLLRTNISVIYADNISHFGLSVCFDRSKGLSCFDMLFDFDLLFQNMVQRNCINCCLKNECLKTLEMLTVAFGESAMSSRRNKARVRVSGQTSKQNTKSTVYTILKQKCCRNRILEKPKPERFTS